MTTVNIQPIVIIDLSEPIRILSKARQQYFLFERFPLKEIISLILSLHHCQDYDEALAYETDDRFKDVTDQFDYNNLDFFFSTVVELIDEHIRLHFPKEVDPTYYVLDRWLGQTTIVLKQHAGY